MRKRVLLVAHSEWRERRITPMLAERGYDCEWRCPAHGDRLPDNLDDLGGAIVFGGVQSANDADTQDYMRHELDWIGRFVRAGGRYLGICLGGQLLARALGAKVEPHPEALQEIGYVPIEPTEVGREIFDGTTFVYHWHKEGFGVPAGAELLAKGERFPNQAFRAGSAYGFQFHPEVTGSDVRGWLQEVTDYETRPGAPSRADHLAGVDRHDENAHRWMSRFVDHWLGGKAKAGR